MFDEIKTYRKFLISRNLFSNFFTKMCAFILLVTTNTKNVKTQNGRLNNARMFYSNFSSRAFWPTFIMLACTLENFR